MANKTKKALFSAAVAAMTFGAGFGVAKHSEKKEKEQLKEKVEITLDKQIKDNSKKYLSYSLKIDMNKLLKSFTTNDYYSVNLHANIYKNKQKLIYKPRNDDRPFDTVFSRNKE